MNAISSRPLPARPLALPNLLTYARIAAVPVVAGLMFWQSIFDGPLWLRWVALTIFILAGGTDILDGYLARTWGQQSSLGHARSDCRQVAGRILPADAGGGGDNSRMESARRGGHSLS